ncbi:MAG: hypothetical protein Q7U60_09745 [Candidatus Methanoperedens sp.]|nr:hypothetical protein [Candidatus Methanoperedens sp.]
MPDWPTHLIVPLLALLIVSKKEHQKYILLLLPLAVIPDFDTFATQHRALLHNIFIPLLLLLFGLMIKEYRTIFIIASVYIASHVFLDMFGGGVVLFYPLYNGMAFVDASLAMSKTNELIWVFDYGFREYGAGWETAYGYISDSIGTGAMVFVFLAGVCVAYRNWRGTR